MFLFRAIHRHYAHVSRQWGIPDGWQDTERVHLVVLLVGGVHRGTLEALAYARALRPDGLVAVHVAADEDTADQVYRQWGQAHTGVDLTVVIDQYRKLYERVTRIINELDDHDEHSHLTVVIPEFTTHHWWEALLHNQSAWPLKANLAKRPNTVTISVPLRPLTADTEADADAWRRAVDASSGDGRPRRTRGDAPTSPGTQRVHTTC